MKSINMTAFIDWEETPVALKRISILHLSKIMETVRRTDSKGMVWWHGKIISTTLPSSYFF